MTMCLLLSGRRLLNAAEGTKKVCMDGRDSCIFALFAFWGLDVHPYVSPVCFG